MGIGRCTCDHGYELVGRQEQRVLHTESETESTPSAGQTSPAPLQMPPGAEIVLLLFHPLLGFEVNNVCFVDLLLE